MSYQAVINDHRRFMSLMGRAGKVHLFEPFKALPNEGVVVQGESGSGVAYWPEGGDNSEQKLLNEEKGCA